MSAVAAVTLESIGAALMEVAKVSTNGRAAKTLHSGSRLRQTLIAMTSSTKLDEHKSPGDATLICLSGAVALHFGDRIVAVPAGTLVNVPPQRHDIVADDDAVILLTVAIA